MKNINKPLLVLFLLVLTSFAGYSQTCTLNVTISSPSSTICSGKNVTLTANISGGTGPFTYVWSTGESTSSIDVNKAGTYTVTVSDKTPGCQPKSANFAVTAVASPNPPTVASPHVCPNTSATLTATAPGGTYQWYDANGNFLFTGNPYVTPAITQATLFYVETTVGSCTSTRSSVIVYVTGGPSIQSDPVCYGSPATLKASGANSYAWYADASGTGTPLSIDATFTTPALFANTTYYLFTITNGCSSAAIPVVARINAPPAVPVVTPANNSVCSGSSINLHADASGVVEWYDVPSGGTPLISSPDYTTPVLTSPVTYYIQTRVGDCTSDRIPVPVSVTPIPAAPPSQSPATCYGTSITLTADPSPTGTYNWYTSATGGTAVATGNTFSTPVLTSNKTYYVEHATGSCTSDRTPVTVTVTPAPDAPVVPDGPVVCNGSSTPLTATSTQGGTFQWFATATGGTALFSGATFTTPALTATTTYYVQTTVGTCISDRSAITVTVLDPVSNPVVQPVPAICSGTSATLTATGSPDDYEWYDQAAGGNLLVTGDTYVTPELTANTTYYVQSKINDCTSARIAVTVQVNPLPAAPAVNGTATVCPGQSATLNVAASGGTIQWYTDATGGTPVYTGNTYTTNPLFAQTIFYAGASNGSCSSPRTAFTVSITPVIDPQFRYPSGTICTSGSNVTPTIYNPAGGVFSSSPAGLVFVSNTTGEINVAASALGKYTVIFTYGGTCAGAASQSISIVTTPDARFSYNTPFCTDMKNPLPVFGTGASAGIFSESTGNVVFKNPSTGEIDLNNSHAGTYTITNTIAASAGCAQSIATSPVTIYKKVAIYAGPDQTVPQDVPVHLAGDISGGTSSGKWTGGAGTFSDPTKKDAIYTPAAGETHVVLTLTSDDPAGPCSFVSSKVTIDINPIPAAPTAQGKSVCTGNTTTLIATAPGGSYHWYNTATGGTALKAGPIFITPPILSDITYYVETTVNGITSKRTPVLVHVLAPPAAPTVGTDNKATVCEGQSAILTASGSTGTYTWYNLPVGGTPIHQGNPFPTTQLTTNRTYYVETKVNDCISERTKVEVTVTPAPQITSNSTSDPICSGTALNYTITADQPGATFSWDRKAVPGISNAAVTGQTTSSITETLINNDPKGLPVNVTYDITPYLNGCPGTMFQYTVTVNATPVVTSVPPGPVCNGSSTNYQVKFNTQATSFTWSRDAVAGISNAAVTGQAASTIKEVLYNTTNDPIEVTYVFNFKTNDCPGVPYPLKVTVNPGVSITSPPPSDPKCNNTPLGITLESNISTATYLWSRPVVPGISNAAATDQTANPINEALVNTTTNPIQVPYTITPVAFGCPGTPVKYTVTVRPQTLKIDGHSNTPVCEGSDIVLLTQPIAGTVTYLWTGPNNYRSETQSPNTTIPNATAANAGTYYLSLVVNGCPGEPSPIPVVVNSIPMVDAGPSRPVCISVPFIQLEGSTSRTAIWSAPAGGTFAKLDDPTTQYFPSAADRAAGSVTLTLTSTGVDCAAVVKKVTFTFAPSPGADAGPPSIDNVCNQNPMVALSGDVYSGTTMKWTSASGLGKFIPSDDIKNPTFQPDPIDIAKGSVTLTLRATQADDCHTPTDDITINFVPPPTVQADAAGDTRYVLKDHTITLNPVVGSENVTYEWSPATGLDNTTVKNPVVTGDQDITYQLKITDKSNGCVNYSQVAVKVSPVINVSNTFTPNGDGINDNWEIKGLVAYESSTVDVYNRYGQALFHSVGYPKPWDGTYQGKALPAGTYYYIVNTKMNNIVLSGYVVILR